MPLCCEGIGYIKCMCLAACCARVRTKVLGLLSLLVKTALVCLTAHFLNNFPPSSPERCMHIEALLERAEGRSSGGLVERGCLG